jgi:hypothetical protein
MGSGRLPCLLEDKFLIPLNPYVISTTASASKGFVLSAKEKR